MMMRVEFGCSGDRMPEHPCDCVTIDGRGRLIIVDDNVISDAVDRDGDGFEETIIVGAADAGRIVAGDAQALYESVRGKVGDWELSARPEPIAPIHAVPERLRSGLI